MVEETRVHRENHQPVARHWHTLSYNVVSSTPRHERESNSQLYVIGTDCIGSCNIEIIFFKTGKNLLQNIFCWKLLFCIVEKLEVPKYVCGAVVVVIVW
jgi:hypothetical protein